MKILFENKDQNYLLLLKGLLILLFSLMSHSINAEESNSVYEITSPVSGVIGTIHVNAGKTVKKGDLLLEYDISLINSNLSEAKANMELAKIKLSEARKEYERAEELYERTVLSEHDLQMAKVEYSQAKAQHARGKNLLIHAQWEMTHSKLYAPFSGKVTRVLSYPGQYVNNQMIAQKLLMIKKSE